MGHQLSKEAKLSRELLQETPTGYKVFNTLVLMLLYRNKTSKRPFVAYLLLCFLANRFGARRRLNDETPMKDPELNYQHWPVIGKLLSFNAVKKDMNMMSLKFERSRGWTGGEVYMPGVMILNVIEECDIKYCLKDNFKNYVKNSADSSQSLGEVFGEMLGSGIFGVDGAEWAVHRKVASHLFKGKVLNDKMTKVFTSHARVLLKTLDAIADTDKSIDIQCLFASFTFDAFCEIAFGISPKSVESFALTGEKIEFLEAFDDAQQLSVTRLVKLPFLWRLQRKLDIGDEAKLRCKLKILDDYVYDIVRQRKQEMKDNSNSSQFDDLLSLFIQYGINNKEPEVLTDEYLRDMILNFMIAGRDTTSCVLTNMFMLLSKNPDCESKLRSEFAKMISGHEPSAIELGTATYADAVFNEALRMYPSVGTDIRFCVHDDVLPSGRKVRAGTTCSVSMFSIGRNPRLYAQPDDFIPERWLQNQYAAESPQSKKLRSRASSLAENEDEKSYPSGTLRVPEFLQPVFWAGPRTCLGRNAARLEAKLTAAMILDKFEIKVGNYQEAFMNSPVMFYKYGMPAKVYRRR